jgi:hypothetical protein
VVVSIASPVASRPASRLASVASLASLASLASTTSVTASRPASVGGASLIASAIVSLGVVVSDVSKLASAVESVLTSLGGAASGAMHTPPSIDGTGTHIDVAGKLTQS